MAIKEYVDLAPGESCLVMSTRGKYTGQMLITIDQDGTIIYKREDGKFKADIQKKV